MKRETIERLAIDSAAGELNEDAQSLFIAYLAEHAPANEWAQSILRVYRQTEAAIGAKTKAADAGSETVAVRIKPVFPGRWRAALRWAAVVVLAALVGAGAGRWSRSIAIPAGPVELATFRPMLAASRPGPDMANMGQSFWHAKAAAMFTGRSDREHNNIVQAHGLWEKYKQYTKGNHNE